MQTNRRAANCT